MQYLSDQQKSSFITYIETFKLYIKLIAILRITTETTQHNLMKRNFHPSLMFTSSFSIKIVICRLSEFA